MQQKMVASIVRAMRGLPFGYIVEPFVAMGEAVAEMGV